MCGIAGIVNFRKAPSSQTLTKMLEAIRYRGPDSAGKFLDSQAALGVRRLRIIDLVSGEQPIYNEDKTICVVYNGEIYNYLEIREQLQLKGHKFRTQTDTETLVHLYEEYGEDLAKGVNGMFAFALWDKKKRKLILGRDQSGIKPLYYFHKGDTLVFGSEIKSILASRLYIKEFDSEAINDYLTLGFVPGEKSMFKGVYKLPPGSVLVFDKKIFKIHHYWNAPEEFIANDENLEDLIANSIKRQLVADVPVGVFLSGGLDSSLITYFSAREKQNIKSFSISFKDEGFDEAPYARKVAKILKTDHYEETFTAKDVVELFPTITSKMDQPIADASLFPTYKVCELARKHVTVCLSGEGGDEMFGGYTGYRGSIAESMFGMLPQIVRKHGYSVAKFLPVSSKYYKKSPEYHKFLKGMRFPHFLRHLYWDNGVDYKDSRKNLERISTEQWFIELIREIDNHSHWSSSQRLQYFDYRTHLIDCLLVKADQASMFNSLEVRVPYLDIRTVNYCFRDTIRHADLTKSKILLKEVAKGKIPNEIIDREKKGFVIPISKWVRGELADFIAENLRNQKLYDYINKEEIYAATEKHKNRVENHSRFLWTALMFSGWLQNMETS